MPERFNSTNQTNPDHEGYIPFGGGKRQCLGARLANLEMKILAAMLIRGYDWELLPEQNLEIEQIPTPHPRDGLKVDFWRF